MSFSTVKSAAMEGLAVEMVYVEADVSNGLPIFHMVGYLSSEVKGTKSYKLYCSKRK